MPITTQFPLRVLTYEEFGSVAYDVLKDVFTVHNQIGRFFDEKIYMRSLHPDHVAGCLE